MARRIGSARKKVGNHRAELREAGLGPVQFWMPNVRAKSFVAAARKQSRAIAKSEQKFSGRQFKTPAIAKSEHECADQDFVDAISIAD
jgi:hypothetical protein